MITKSKKIAILAHSFSNENYGALMVPFALQEILKDLGFNPSIINITFSYKSVKIFEDFRNHFLLLTKKYYIYSNWKQLNKDFDTFIVGSDQVWRNWWNNNSILFKFFLDFAAYNKKLISYAASFGKSSFDVDIKTQQHIKLLLSSFEAISVREKTGVDICKDLFNISAVEVIDPTLLCPISHYDKIINSETHQFPERFIVAMIFPEMYDSQDMDEFINNISHNFGNIPVIRIFSNNNSYRSFSEWLYLIKHAEFVITDSFHGLCFSINYERQFVCFDNAEGGSDRFISLLAKLGLTNRLYNDCKKVNIQEFLNEEINYGYVNSKLAQYKEESKEFLINTLEKDIYVNSKYFYRNKMAFDIKFFIHKLQIIKQCVLRLIYKT